MRLMALFRRFSHRLFLEWRSGQKQPHHQITPDFFGAKSAEHQRLVCRCLRACQPNLQTLS